jgi:CHAD domain-containing protein
MSYVYWQWEGSAMTNRTEATGKTESDAVKPVTASTPVWAACRILLSGHEGQFFSRLGKVLKSFQEDDVHDLRVASRRLREGLALFSVCLPPGKLRRIDKQVKKVTKMLGELRNTDEAYLFFSQLPPEDTGNSCNEIEQLLTSLKQERKKAHRKLKSDLGHLDPVPLKKEIEALGSRQNIFGDGAADAFTGVAAFAGGAIMERAQAVQELLPEALHEEDTGSQHALRIAVKKLRYRLEILAPLITKRYQELHDTLKGYQDVLGKLHDVVVFREMVEARIPEGAGREELLNVLTHRQRDLHASFVKKQKSAPLGTIGGEITDALGQ